jgi:THO complex subunit 2
MLRYIIHQLRGSDHKDTVILQDLISNMCGIYPVFELSESQIIALRGGPILRTEAVASNVRGVLSNFNPRTADRFNSTLKSTGLLLPLLILIAQNRQSCIHISRNDHLKTLGHLFDTVGV